MSANRIDQGRFSKTGPRVRSGITAGPLVSTRSAVSNGSVAALTGGSSGISVVWTNGGLTAPDDWATGG